MASVTGFSKKNHGQAACFKDIYLVDGKRTPFGKLKGTLASVSLTDLAILTSRACLSSSGIDPTEIDQTIATNIGMASADAFFLPRHIALYSGAPLAAPAVLVQRLCGSGMEVIGTAAEQIGLKKSHLILTAGAEVMSRIPVASFTARMGFDLGRPEFIDFLWDGLNDSAATSMGCTADLLAKEYKIGRHETDQFALKSQERYLAAHAAGFFKSEIVSVPVKGQFEREGLNPRKFKINGKEDFTTDENPRSTTLEKLGNLPSIFSQEGPTTAGNASGIVDGAASLLVASADHIKAHGIKPLGKILAYSTVGVDPRIMGIGPFPAINLALEAAGLQLKDIDLLEINEAFGAQCLAVSKALELDPAKLNIHGGAMAIGHPLAATGLRLVLTLLHALRSKNKTLGIASACIGGGQGIAVIVERV